MCYQENEEYCLNRLPKKAKTEGMVYYFQKIDGVVVKTEITVEQWKELYLFNKRLYRSNLKHYDDRYFSRFLSYQNEDGDEADLWNIKPIRKVFMPNGKNNDNLILKIKKM